MKKAWVSLGFVVAVLLLSLAPKVEAAFPVYGDDSGDQVIFGENYRLESGQSVNHGLVFVGCNAVIDKDAQVNGSVTVAGGNLELRKGSRINGNVVLIGGNLDADGATVNGDIGGTGSVIDLSGGTKINGTVYLGPGCTLKGNSFHASAVMKSSKLPFKFGKKNYFSWGRGPFSIAPSAYNGPVFVGMLLGFYKFVLAMFLILLLGVAVVAVWPREVRAMGSVALSEVVTSFAMGFVVILLGFPVALILVILLITLPFGLLLLLLLMGAMVVGWISVALMAGEKLLLGFNVENPTPIFSVVVGGALLILLGKVPCVGWMISFVAVVLGTGAVVLTRFGTKEYGVPRHSLLVPQTASGSVGGEKSSDLPAGDEKAGQG